MTEDNYLLLAMEALVDPVRSKVIQDGPVGSGLAGQKTVTVELPCLLRQLNEAIGGTIGIGGSGSLPWTRNMLDADALFRFMKINSTIKEWARMVGAQITPDEAWTTLRAWYVAYNAQPHTEAQDGFYASQMRGWAEQIRQKFQPVRTWDLPGACPVCEAETWWSKATREEYKFPLIVEYNETGPDLIQQARAMCRACEQVWTVRELAFALESVEQTMGESAHGDTGTA